MSDRYETKEAKPGETKGVIPAQTGAPTVAPRPEPQQPPPVQPPPVQPPPPDAPDQPSGGGATSSANAPLS